MKNELNYDDFCCPGCDAFNHNAHDAAKALAEDAARYRWLMKNAKLGIGRNGKDWDLQVDGPAPDAISEVSAWIDSHPDLMDGKAKCQHCGSQFDDFTEEAEFIGWHGVCVKCFMSEDNHA